MKAAIACVLMSFQLVSIVHAQTHDPTCDFPLLDEPDQKVDARACKQLSEDPYSQNFIKYVCSAQCTDLKLCLKNFDQIRKKHVIAKAIANVKKTTDLYPKDHRTEKCGNYEPNPPVDSDDDTLWDAFKNFVDARRKLNGLLKQEVVKVKNTCIRKDNTKGAFMRFQRTERLEGLLSQCGVLSSH